MMSTMHFMANNNHNHLFFHKAGRSKIVAGREYSMFYNIMKKSFKQVKSRKLGEVKYATLASLSLLGLYLYAYILLDKYKHKDINLYEVLSSIIINIMINIGYSKNSLQSIARELKIIIGEDIQDISKGEKLPSKIAKFLNIFAFPFMTTTLSAIVASKLTEGSTLAILCAVIGVLPMSITSGFGVNNILIPFLQTRMASVVDLVRSNKQYEVAAFFKGCIRKNLKDLREKSFQGELVNVNNISFANLHDIHDVLGLLYGKLDFVADEPEVALLQLHEDVKHNEFVKSLGFLLAVLFGGVSLSLAPAMIQICSVQESNILLHLLLLLLPFLSSVAFTGIVIFDLGKKLKKLMNTFYKFSMFTSIVAVMVTFSVMSFIPASGIATQVFLKEACKDSSWIDVNNTLYSWAPLLGSSIFNLLAVLNIVPALTLFICECITSNGNREKIAAERFFDFMDAFIEDSADDNLLKAVYEGMIIESGGNEPSHSEKLLNLKKDNIEKLLDYCDYSRVRLNSHLEEERSLLRSR